MLDHVSIQCADPAVSAACYDAVLATVGGGRVMDFGEVIGYYSTDLTRQMARYLAPSQPIS
jgi:hypothetical protein